mmetsp:Transcript_30800/g.57735  ORF Transcript_30800/g.57735 Transcript_30800/m.57735 type:complete len:175 (+) Transcript_30800:78-602(+)
MGTPSGSKNQNLFMDRLLGKDVISFDGGAYMGPGAAGADLGYQAQKEVERRLEKAQKSQETREFRRAASDHRIEQAMLKPDRVAQALARPEVPVGPQAPQVKKRIPNFVKLKSKEDAFEEKEPDTKRARVDGGPEPAPQAALTAAASSPTSSPAGGSLLGGYESSDEEGDDDQP